MTSVFPVETLGMLKMIVDIPVFSVWGRGKEELLGGEEAGCLARKGQQEPKKLFLHFFLLVPILPLLN